MRWQIRTKTYGYEPSVTDARKPKKQIYQNVRLQARSYDPVFRTEKIGYLCVRWFQISFVNELTGEANHSSCFTQDVVTDHTADFLAFGKWVTFGSVRLPTADADWHPYDYCFRGTPEIVSVNNLHSLQRLNTVLEENLRIFSDNSRIEKCCERVRGMLTDSMPALGDSKARG